MPVNDTATSCQCSGPGFCPLMRREMTPTRHAECRDKPHYFEMFLSERDKPEREAKIRERSGSTCVHRGDVIATRPADLCGQRGQLYDVHACAIHGECVTRRTCQRQRERFCLTCDEFTEPEGETGPS